LAVDYPEPLWADSDCYENLLIVWQPEEQVGVHMVQEEDDPEPIVVFLPFLQDPQYAFYQVTEVRQFGMTLSRLKEVVRVLEEKSKATSWGMT
jgi:hypothetical protein